MAWLILAIAGLSALSLSLLYVTVYGVLLLTTLAVLLSAGSSADNSAAYLLAPVVVLALAWSLGSLPRLGIATVFAVSLTAKTVTIILVVYTQNGSTASSSSVLYPATLASGFALDTSLDLRSSILHLSSCAGAASSSPPPISHVGIGLPTYLLVYTAASSAALFLQAGARSHFELSAAIAALLSWTGLPLSFLGLLKLVVSVTILSSIFLVALLFLALWSLGSSRVLLLFLFSPYSAPVWTFKAKILALCVKYRSKNFYAHDFSF